MNLNTVPEHTTDPDVRHMVIYENLTAGLGGKVALSSWVGENRGSKPEPEFWQKQQQADRRKSVG